MKQNTRRVLLTGGHAATTAIAIVEEISKTKNLKDIELSFVGARFAMEGYKVETLEYKNLSKFGVKFYSLVSGRLQTKFTRYTIVSLLKIPIGFIQSFFLLLEIRPSVVLSFGGFASFPIVFWAYLFRIPVILHEQTIAAGRAAILSGFFATKIAISREESRKFFSTKKTVFTGNPVMDAITKINAKTQISDRPLILVMGGSRGANFINKLFMSLTPHLLSSYRITHITGEKDFGASARLKEALPEKIREGYTVLPVVNPIEMSNLYELADLVVSRAGANTVSEILYVKRPTVLIPLPHAFLDEQTKNARFAENFGIAKVISQKEANPENVEIAISDFNRHYSTIVKKVVKKDSPDKDASQKIVKLLSEYI